MKNYTVFHLHSDLSNPTTKLDCATKFKMYVDKAHDYGMKAIAFSEHGNIFEYYNKKKYIESKDMKYIHAVEAYVTKDLSKKVRDNYHIMLIALNFEGFLELNYLMSDKVAFNRNDGHFYYNPRITYEELKSTSKNIAITSACLGGILNSEDIELKKDFLLFMIENRERCFLEVQHHLVKDQIVYNQFLLKASKVTGLRLIAGTDTHSLNQEYAEARIVLQRAKNIHFENEEGWDLTFKNYNELVGAYKKQNSLPEDTYIEAIENTNALADMVEEFELDKSIKYPKLYDNPEKVFKDKISKAYKKHKYVHKHDKELLKEKINQEVEVYKTTKSIDYMLLQNYLREWERDNDIYCGYARGSSSGSIVAYILGITEMDSIRFGLNFFRFANPNRVTNFDIDTDYSEADRKRVKKFLLENNKWNASEIITFNTIKLKGAIRDVGRALEIPLSEVDQISKSVEFEEEALRKKYPKLFKYTDIINGTIVSIGTHPAGVLITDRDIQKNVGTCTLTTTDYPVSCLDMKELDELMYVKLDILGIDNIQLINETCKLANIERKTPDNINLEDMNVWNSIRDDTTGIFQWESSSAQDYLRKFMSDKVLNMVKNKIDNFSMIKWFSFGNGLIRPACSSYRDSVANGEFYDNGLEQINDFLAPTMGRVTMQEDIMLFLVNFCDYSEAESDVVRRGIAKKYGTEKLLPEIKTRFVDFSSKKYNISKEKCEEIIEPFLEVVLAASSYAFSWNHSDTYSCIGYVCGWLRYYYPLEFLTVALNVFENKEEKMKKIIEYANKIDVKVNPIKFRNSLDTYMMNKEENSIYKGIASIKYMNHKIARELYDLRDSKYDDFVDLLIDIIENTSCNKNQMEILIKLDFFSEFGKTKYLFDIYTKFIKRYKKTHKDKTKVVRKQEVKDYMKELENEDFGLLERAKTELDYLGYIKTTDNSIPLNYAIVSGIETNKWGTNFLTLYRVNDGTSEQVKIYKKTIENHPLKEFDMIKTITIEKKNKKRKIDDKWISLEETELILNKYAKVVFDKNSTKDVDK